jgi:hypothetical protein
MDEELDEIIGLLNYGASQPPPGYKALPVPKVRMKF